MALVTDGRMSGAWGKVPAKVGDGDLIRLDAVAGTLAVLLPEDEWAARETTKVPEAQGTADGQGLGRERFAGMRCNALSAEQGA